MEEELEKLQQKNKTWLITAIVLLVLYVVAIIIYTIIMIIESNSVISSVAKPIVYLYPEEETEITVKLGNPEKLTTTYPHYQEEWKVIAQPNGDLQDVTTGRNLYALYWEGRNTNHTNWENGFCIKGSDTIAFLEEKLAILGLNEREAEEFIVYWLPQMEHNEYNLIRFERMGEINTNMPLEITPTPDTLIRVVMEFKPVKDKVELPEQSLTQVERKGYTVVEWGGTKVE